MKRLVALSLLCLPALAQEVDRSIDTTLVDPSMPRPAPYAGADATETIVVGDTLPIEPPGPVTQVICDRVGELIDAKADATHFHVKALAPGVTACTFTGFLDRDDGPDGQRSGVVDYRWMIKLVIVPKPTPAE